MPDTIFPSCQHPAIIGFCEFCSIPSQAKQKKPLLDDNKLSTSWPLLSPHLWQSPLRSTNWRLQGLVRRAWKKNSWARVRVTTLQPSAHIIHVGSMMFEKHPHQTQTLLPNWWGEKYEFMKMNKGGGETQWKSWASPGTSSIKVCTSVFPPNGLISLSQKVPVPFHGSKGMCNNKSWLEGKL